MTEPFAKRLGLKLNPVDVTVSGFSLASSTIKHSCEADITSIRSQYKLHASFLVTPIISNQLPTFPIDISSITIPNHITLADPDFATPQSIDILLGAEHFYNLLCIGQISLGRDKPTLQKSKLGWLISGMAAGFPRKQLSRTSCNTALLDDGLTRFWEVEEIPAPYDELYHNHPCEQHFRKTVSRDSNGRFIVSIPTYNLAELGDTRDIAMKRFLNVERSLERQPELRELYVSFMDEYLSLGHMTPSNCTENTVYYLPHHGVRKESSTTSKLRVVYDGSAKPSFGKSLNECQLVGPCVQNDLFSILVRFRRHRIAFSADIEKMYRQILVKPNERSLQRIFWRSHPNQPIQTFDLCTVTYGTGSAAYLSTRCLVQIANDLKITQPEIADRIFHDFYVDDLLSGADNVEEAIEMVRGIKSALSDACMPLRKWTSNCPELLLGLHHSDSFDIDFSSIDGNSSNTLGLVWDSQHDILKYHIKPLVHHASITKRNIVSNISQIFDPLGLLSPCVIIAKIIIQKLWAQKVNWDQSLPSDLYHEWTTYRDSLNTLNSITIPRYALRHNLTSVQLHGFCDASIKAYGAAIFLRYTDSYGNVACTLLCSKGRVAPLKVLSVPRLELCGAYLLSCLVEKVSKVLNLPLSPIVLWSDSTIVLSWLRQCPSILQTFVANRVSKIQSLTDNAEWRHVPTSDNLADLISRGIAPEQLINSSLWWSGPTWLCQPPSQWPPSIIPSDTILELRPNVSTSLQTSINRTHFLDITKFSLFSKLVRIVAYVLRFLHNIRNPHSKLTRYITLDERNASVKVLIAIEQAIHFANEITALQKQRSALNNTKITALSPFLDDAGLLRVGGRLQQSSLDAAAVHPILLPNTYLTKLIFRFEHLRLFHIGPSGLINEIRQRYWPINGRNIARRIVHDCIVCFRAKPRSFEPKMGQLPRARVNPAPPFYHSGIDYAGPITLKTLPGRGGKTYKAYLALFICFAIKAVHLEIVTDLSTRAFLAALRRFVARRGKPAVIESDNATNFVGANRELSDLANFIKMNASSIEEMSDSEGIAWKFIPARSAHFGGLWESEVKSAKYHIKRVVGDQLLTFEDYYTFLVQVEAMLNSRPLTPLSSDPNDLSVLTPAHFLIGRPLVGVHHVQYTNAISHCSRYQHAQIMAQQLWSRWSKEYLNTLQQRSRWRKTGNHPTIKPDMMVILMDDGLPPNKWKLGRITETHAGPDGEIRVVSIRTNTGVTKRAVRRICPLPIETNDDDETAG